MDEHLEEMEVVKSILDDEEKEFDYDVVDGIVSGRLFVSPMLERTLSVFVNPSKVHESLDCLVPFVIISSLNETSSIRIPQESVRTSQSATSPHLS